MKLLLINASEFVLKGLRRDDHACRCVGEPDEYHPQTIVMIAPEIKRFVFIDAEPELVFTYLTDLSNHGEWDGHLGFAIVSITEGPMVEGSFCQKERMETFDSPILRSGMTINQVTWTKILTIVGCEPNNRVDFETENLYNGLSIGSESVSFKLQATGAGTVLEMTDRKNPHLPGPFHVLMMGIEVLKSWISLPIVGFMFWLFPDLQINSELRRIKNVMERV